MALAIFLIPIVSAQIIINEVMPNPIDDCSDCTEWVEIYNNESPTNISLWILNAGGKNITLNGFIEDYIIVTKNKTKFLQIWQINDSKIIQGTTSLNNDGDEVILYNNNLSIMDNVAYPPINENKTYSKLLNLSWSICGPTPSMQNNCSQSQEQEQNQSNQTNPTISINYPYEVLNNGTEFEATLNLSNFEPASYDLKIEIKNGTSNIGRIFTGEEWQSTFYWIYNAFSLSSSDFLHIARLKIDPEKSFSGVASIQAKVRKTNTSEIFESSSLNLIILPSAPMQEDEEQENETDIQENESQHDYEYFITNIPEIITENNTNFTISIRIKNNQNESKTFELWSYVYRANKCYSQDREANKKEMIVNAKAENSTELYNQLNLSEIKENGDYKLKVKILRTEIKTPKEFTYNRTINISGIKSFKSFNDENEEISSESHSNNSNVIEYLSKSEKIKKSSAYIFLAVCIAIAAYIAIKKKL